MIMLVISCSYYVNIVLTPHAFQSLRMELKKLQIWAVVVIFYVITPNNYGRFGFALPVHPEASDGKFYFVKNLLRK